MSLQNNIITDLQKLRETTPLVHNITNYVVMNTTANALLSIGASPVMAHALNEVADMTRIASSLVINIGTLSEHWVEAMLLAGKTANEKGIPIILDPVGAGATTYRTETCFKIINQCKPSIIRGNASEIMSLINEKIVTKGVDSTATSDSALESAKILARETGAIITISGSVDFITDGSLVIKVANGVPLMSKVTGMGCIATAITGAFAAINKNYLQAAANAMVIMGIAGEMAFKKSMSPGTFQPHFLDALYTISEKEITKLIKVSQ